MYGSWLHELFVTNLLKKEGRVRKTLVLTLILSVLGAFGAAYAADVVPNEIMMPGTQPREVGNFESPNRCDNCHAGYDQSTYSTEPAFGWRGSAMGNAGRDPIFWATLAIAEQDFDGAGDLCIRCHSAAGWYAGRSTPTDGSGLFAGDGDGIDCDTCHLSTNPDQSEHIGVYFPPFEPFGVLNGIVEGYYGSGMLQVWGGNEKLGPYTADDAKAKHQRMQSEFHRSEDFCGTCHDVSNSAVGDLAPNNGTQPGAPPVISSWGTGPGGGPNLGGPIEDKAAFNNPPYAYGIVERTYSEYKASAFTGMPISNFGSLPADLQVAGGALELAANAAGPTNDDGTARYFTCQSCHMKATTGIGCNKRGVPTRNDLPVHDLTGGNYWIYALVKYQDQQGTLRMGGDLTVTQIAAMDAGTIRAENSLRSTASMEVTGNTVKLTNLTGHKAITGYPEGRRMWLNIKWYDGNGTLLREDGKYGPLTGVSVTYTASDGTSATFTPESVIDLDGSNTKIYEAHYGMTKEWADVLLSVGYPADLALSYDRETGDVDFTLGDLAALTNPWDSHETFHFAINNHVVKDNRIPPYLLSYDEAKRRNALPVPETQYGDPGPGGTYDYHDVVGLNPPAGATYADITLYYQGTSWEYVQFLWKGNNGTDPAQGGNAFLGEEGVNMLDAWVKTGMVPPFAMATAAWGTPPGCTPVTEGPPGDATCSDGIDNDCDDLIDAADPDCQEAVDCSDYTIKNDCNAQPTCRWDNKNKVCIPN
jgi:hypothetical protein